MILSAQQIPLAGMLRLFLSGKGWSRLFCRLGRFDWADALLLVIGLAAVVLCLRGLGDPFTWIFLASLLPMGRFLVFPEYRQRVQTWAMKRWEELEQYAAQGGIVPWKATFYYAILPTALLYLADETTFYYALDSRPVIPTAISLVTEGNLDLDEFARSDVPDSLLIPGALPWWVRDTLRFGVRDNLFLEGHLPWYLRQTEHGIYTQYQFGMVPFALPVVALARMAGADLHSLAVQHRLEKLTAAWLAAASIGLFFLIALNLARPEPALVTTIILTLGSTMYSTVGQYLWQHGGIVFCFLGIILLEFTRKNKRISFSTVVQGLACGLMLECRPASSLLIIVFGFWVLLRAPARAFMLAFISILAYAPWAWLHWTIYGNPLGSGTCQLDNYWWSHIVARFLPGVLISPGRGLFIYQPWLLLLGICCFPSIRSRLATLPGRSGPIGWDWFCLTAIVLQVLVISSWQCWWGGGCWGSRLLSEVIPLGALLCVRPIALLWSTAIGKRAVLSLAVLSLFLHVGALHFRADLWNMHPNYVGCQRKRLWSWTNPPFCDLTLP